MCDKMHEEVVVNYSRRFLRIFVEGRKDSCSNSNDDLFLSHDTEIKIGIPAEIFKVDVEVNLEEFLAALPRPLPFPNVTND
jgi:hypothetical protein